MYNYNYYIATNIVGVITCHSLVVMLNEFSQLDTHCLPSLFFFQCCVEVELARPQMWQKRNALGETIDKEFTQIGNTQ